MGLRAVRGMTYPIKASLQYSYTGFQQSQGNNAFPGTQIDNDLVRIVQASDQVIDFLKVSFGSDGRLGPRSVGLNALAFEIRSLFSVEALALVDAIASNIALSPVVGMSATNLQTAIEELFSGKAASDHGHAASSIPIQAISNLTAATVQAALEQLRALGPQTGYGQLTLNTVAAPGWVMMDDGTIGPAGSGASTRGNNDCEALYKLIYAVCSNTWAPVTGGRGANSNTDWLAGKPIALTRQLGRAIAIAGVGAGLTNRQIGAFYGVEKHALSGGEIAEHYHDVYMHDPQHAHNDNRFAPGAQTAAGPQSPGGSNQADGNTGPASTGITIRDAAGGGGNENRTAPAGSGDEHENMQPSAFWNVQIKL